MAFDTHSLEAYSLVATAPSPASSGTTLTVTAGQGVLFAINQNCTVFPVGSQPTTANSEIVRITGISADTLTITRAQEGSVARSIIIGDQIANTVTPKVLTDVESIAVAGDKLQNLSGTQENIVLSSSSNWQNSNTLEVGSSYVFEIAATDTVEIESYIDQPYLNGFLDDAVMGMVFQSADTAGQNVPINRGGEFFVNNLLEIGNQYFVEIPNNSSLEIIAWAMQGGNAVNAATSLSASSIDYARLLPNIFLGQVQSQANAGSAGGTMYYVNLGGIKLLWCHSSVIATVTTATGFTFTLPASFFSTIQTVLASPNNPNATGQIYCEVDSYSTTTVNVKITPSANQNTGVDILCIGA